MEKSVELDCAPGSLRPGDLIGGVLHGLEIEVKEPTSMSFGNWTWRFDDIPDERWLEIKPVLKERVIKLYNSGIIRYGSW